MYQVNITAADDPEVSDLLILEAAEVTARWPWAKLLMDVDAQFSVTAVIGGQTEVKIAHTDFYECASCARIETMGRPVDCTECGRAAYQFEVKHVQVG